MLQQQLSSLHKLMCESPLQDTIAKYYEVKLKLEQISKRKTEGGMIRSKARWCEQGERNTRYFLNLERRNHLNKYITELKTENLTLYNPTEILNEEYRYYKNLYPIILQTQMITISLRFLTVLPFQSWPHRKPILSMVY